MLIDNCAVSVIDPSFLIVVCMKFGWGPVSKGTFSSRAISPTEATGGDHERGRAN